MNKLLLLSVLFLMVGCGSEFKKTLGMNKVAPDEFAVLKNPSLSMPPRDYLLPPAEQGKEDVVQSASQDAQEILTGKQQNSQTSSLSSSDRAFLAQVDKEDSKQKDK